MSPGKILLFNHPSVKFIESFQYPLVTLARETRPIEIRTDTKSAGCPQSVDLGRGNPQQRRLLSETHSSVHISRTAGYKEGEGGGNTIPRIFLSVRKSESDQVRVRPDLVWDKIIHNDARHNDGI